MNHEIFKEKMKSLIEKSSKLTSQMNDVDNEKSELRRQYLEFLKQEANINIGDRVMYRGNKCWIYEFAIDYSKSNLVAKLKKVKKDGTNGEQIACSYGTPIDRLIRIKNE